MAGRWETVNPNKLDYEHKASNRKAVEHYKANPDKNYDPDSGRPEALKTRSGRYKLYNGHHRAQAAKESGRNMKVWVEDEEPSAGVTHNSPLTVHAANWKIIVMGGSGGIAVRNN